MLDHDLLPLQVRANRVHIRIERSVMRNRSSSGRSMKLMGEISAIDDVFLLFFNRRAIFGHRPRWNSQC